MAMGAILFVIFIVSAAKIKQLFTEVELGAETGCWCYETDFLYIYFVEGKQTKRYTFILLKETGLKFYIYFVEG